MLTIAVSALNKPKALSKQGQNLQKLWIDFEQKHARNNRYLARQTHFLEYFKAEVAEVELQACQATEQLIQHLFSFLSFKTIKGTQRTTLYRWLREELYMLAANPFQQLEIARYHQQIDQAWLAELQAKYPSPLTKANLKTVRQALEDALALSIPQDDEQLQTLWADTEALLTWMAECRQQQLALAPDEVSPLLALTPCGLDMQQSPWNVLSSSTADFLDACLEEVQAGSTLQLSLDKNQRLAFEQALGLRIRELNLQYQQMQQATDVTSHMWRNFGGGSKAEQQKAVMIYQEELKAAIEGLEEYCQQVTTAKEMNQILADRAQYMYQGS